MDLNARELRRQRILHFAISNLNDLAISQVFNDPIKVIFDGLT